MTNYIRGMLLMFIGKSALACFILSTTVLASNPNNRTIATSAPKTQESASFQAIDIESEDSSSSNQSQEISQEENNISLESSLMQSIEDGQESINSFSEAEEAGQVQDNSPKSEASQQTLETNESMEAPPIEAESLEQMEEPDMQEESSIESSTRIFEESGTELAMLESQGGSQMLSSLIRSQNGYLVVIDGGWEEDGEYLLNVIKEHGGIVDAWLLTHPHSDHAGALYYILNEKRHEISINQIYCSLAPLSWYEEVAPDDAELVGNLMDEFATLPEEVLCDSVGKGDEIFVDNLQITVLNDRYELNSDPVNNSSITYMVQAAGKKILFLGDLSYEGGSHLARELGNRLEADIVQMAHHGQNGVGEEVYKTISPSICLWPTPQWLWDNDDGNGYNSGKWRTIETQNWMKRLKVREQYCTKDGNIVLQLD